MLLMITSNADPAPMPLVEVIEVTGGVYARSRGIVEPSSTPTIAAPSPLHISHFDDFKGILKQPRATPEPHSFVTPYPFLIRRAFTLSEMSQL